MDKPSTPSQPGHLPIVGASEERQHDIRVLPRLADLCGGRGQPVAVL